MKRENKAEKLASACSKGQRTERSCRMAAAIWYLSMLVLTLGSLRAFAASAVEVTDFGLNPGNLRMFKYIPNQLPLSAPLVVVVHGCTQNARTFANQSGWIQLADKMHFALALPEQKQANNQNNWFNWFDAGDTTRDQGETLSIKQMVNGRATRADCAG